MAWIVESLVSPEVASDRCVTFRIYAPRADRVELNSGEIEVILPEEFHKRFQPVEGGVWQLTVGPLPPGIYDYSIHVDGIQTIDPGCPNVFEGIQGGRAYVEVPGERESPRFDEWRDVPYGSVSVHWYVSAALGGAHRRLHVYLPPGYHQNAGLAYPVLYLLHGAGDNDSHWISLGRANVIADSLIAARSMLPLIIVMPDGHAYPLRPPRQVRGGRDSIRGYQRDAFERDLFNEIIPLVERTYRVRAEREAHAIAGLSMGGGQALGAGLSNLDEFAWIGGFSSAVSGIGRVLGEVVSDSQTSNEKIKLLWIAIGKEDFLLEGNHSLIHQLKAGRINHIYRETEGTHLWSVWRRYLYEFLQLIFR